MAFQPWSIPLFVVYAAIGLVLVFIAAKRTGVWLRWILTGVTAVLLAILSAFGWWCNEGGENDIGHELFLMDWGVLLTVVVLMVAISLAVGKARNHRNS